MAHLVPGVSPWKLSVLLFGLTVVGGTGATALLGEPSRRAVELEAPESFPVILEEAEPCDDFTDGRPVEVPGVNGCLGMQPPREPSPQGVPHPGGFGPSGPKGPTTGGPAGPGAPAPSGPTTPGAGYRGGDVTPPSSTGHPITHRWLLAGYVDNRKGDSAASAPPDQGGGTLIHGEKGGSPAARRGGGSTGGGLFDLQPNSVVQGLDILEDRHLGSVSTGSRHFAWGELDIADIGAHPDSGFVFGRRYFSALTHDGEGSTGARWVTSLSECLNFRTTPHGARALHYFHWGQPFNDPDFWYVETGTGTNVYTTSAAVGGEITNTETGVYVLTFKDGAQHTFATADEEHARLIERRDGFGNVTTFVFHDDPQQDNSVLLITDARGVTYTVMLDSYGYMLSVTDPLGATVTFTYEGMGFVKYLTAVVYPQREVYEPNGTITTRTTTRTYHYNIMGRLDEVWDDYGNLIVRNVYDGVFPSKVVSQVNAVGASFTFSNPAAGQTDVISPNGWKRSYLHNSQRQLIELRQYVANFAGNPARSTDQNLYNTWLFDRSPDACNCGPVTKITEPDGGLIELIYSTSFDLLEARKRSADLSAQLVWKWTYDSMHRITSFIPPEGNAAADPTPYTTTITRQTVGGTLQTTTTIPPRDWRTTPSVWVATSDYRGRMLECTGPPHDGTTPSFEGKWEYYGSGSSGQTFMPRRAYRFNSTTVAYTYTWDECGRVSTITDDAARQYSCTYDPEGRPKTWTAPTINVGQNYSHKWFHDGNGRVRAIHWKYYSGDLDQVGTWIEWKYAYDAAGRLLSLTRQLDNDTPNTVAVETWVYDFETNVVSGTDPDGYTTKVTYDERSLPWQLTDGFGTYEYNTEGRLTVILEKVDATRTVRFENEYDNLDRLFRYRIKDSANPATQAGFVETDYEAGSRIGEIRTFAIVGGTPRLTEKKTFTYDDFHDSPTRQVSHAYRLDTGTFLRSVQSDFDYGPSGRAVREWTAGTLIAEYTYEPCGLPKKVQDAYGNRFEVGWDQYGRALTETNAYWSAVDSTHAVRTRTFGRDAFGRTSSITDSGTGVTNQVTTFEFDSSDNVVQRILPDGSAQVYQYRYDGLVTREDCVIHGSTWRARQTEYTPGGRQAVVTDDRNNNVSFIYDGRGRLKQEVHPDGSTWNNAFNDASLLTKITGPSGRTVDFTHDWRGMVTGAIYKDGAGVVKRTDVVQIDAGGFVKKVTKTENGGTGYVELTNDSTGRVLQEVTSLPDGATWAVDNVYDARGRLESMTSPGGYGHLYTYDDRNRVRTVTLTSSSSGSELVATYDYLGAMGAVRRRVTGDGNTLNVTRDGFQRTTRMLTNGASNVADFQYAYDAVSRQVSEFRAFEGKGNAYWYDKLGRLTKTTNDTVNPAGELATPQSTTHAFFREFLLDGDDHRTQVRTTPMGSSTEVTDYATSGTRHFYTQIQTVGQAAVSRSFDLDGRVTAHGTRTMVYDIVDNLVEVKDSGVTTATYEFDALGRRVRTTAGSYTTRFVHAGPWVIEDYRKNNSGSGNEWLKGCYVHGPGIDSVVMMRHRDWKDVDSDVDYEEPVSIYLHANKQGSVTEATDPTGQVVERYRYDEYGKVKVLDAGYVVLPAAVVGNWFLFTGREYDWETGYYHYRARTYDPGTGTFLQEDPLGMHDGMNLVAYVHGDPVNFGDPFGTEGIGDVVDSIMAFIQNNRATIAGLIVDLLGPLEGILDLLSAATGKDITGWVRGGLQGDMASMGWWDRACAAAGAAVKIAAGGLALLGKLKGILAKIEDAVKKFAEQAANAGRHAISPLVGGCFVLGTLVAIDGGDPIPIERVVVGAVVESAVPSAVSGKAPKAADQLVLATWRRTYTGALHTLVLEGADGQRGEVSGTPEHPFWVVDAHCWLPMAEVAAGRTLDGLSGTVRVLGHRVDFVTVEVGNLTVEHSNSFRVTGLGVLVHNTPKYEKHHIMPKYLGGPKNGPTVPLEKDYHQKITNSFRAKHGYGKERPSAERVEEIMNEVYSEYPLPGGK